MGLRPLAPLPIAISIDVNFFACDTVVPRQRCCLASAVYDYDTGPLNADQDNDVPVADTHVSSTFHVILHQ